MIFRISQKLNTKIKVGAVETRPLEANPFADWSAHLFVADRRQYVLVSNTKSLYSVVMHGKGVVDQEGFMGQALAVIREFMQDDGQQYAFTRFVAPVFGEVAFAKALNRSVTGSMNDLVYLATFWIVKGLSPHEIGFKLNETPMSALVGRDGKGYSHPRNSFGMMVGG